MTANKEHFGKRFKQWRQSQGITAYRIAKLIGVHPSFISNIEADRRPMSEEFMRKLAAIPELNLSYQTLRVWKILGEYDPNEIQHANEQLALEKVLIKQDEALAERLELNGPFERIPLRLALTAEGLTEISKTDEKSIGWYSLRQSEPNPPICIEVKADNLWPPIPKDAVLIVREAEQLEPDEKYLVVTNNDEPAFVQVCGSASDKQLVSLTDEGGSVVYSENDVTRAFHALAYKIG